MAKNSAIEWTSHSWSPWVGCTAISPACDNCYAKSWAKRAGEPELWSGKLRRTSEDYWKQPAKWNRTARIAARRERVFPSLCDPFDNQADRQWRADFFGLIEDTESLIWLLLTKRPQNILQMTPPKWDCGLPPNVWIGVTAENQTEADRRREYLRAVPAATKFVSYEPALGPIDWRGWEFVDQIIFGGESGPNARPAHPQWARDTRDFCAANGIAYFHKQWGRWLPNDQCHDRPIRCGKHATISYDGRFLANHDIANPPEIQFTFDYGAKRAGRLLDGVEHNGFPEALSPTPTTGA